MTDRIIPIIILSVILFVTYFSVKLHLNRVRIQYTETVYVEKTRESVSPEGSLFEVWASGKKYSITEGLFPKLKKGDSLKIVVDRTGTIIQIAPLN